MYMGPSTEEPPTPNPPMKRKATKADQFHAMAQPRPETRYRTAITRRLSRRPKRSPGKPASIAPRTVPKSALNTVTPKRKGVRLYVWVRALVVPEMTAVSNPNRRPPSAATIVLFSKVAFSFMRTPAVRNMAR